MKDLFQSTYQIQKKLADRGIPTAVIGGLAVAIWGEPRLTRDVDLKVFLHRDEAEKLINILKAEYTFHSATPVQTLQKLGFIFVKEANGIRLDLLLADTPFDEDVIRRACPVDIEPSVTITVSRPEDLIIYKMISTRGRDREDVRGIIVRQKDRLEDAYILKWLKQFEKALDDSLLVQEYQKVRDTVK